MIFSQISFLQDTVRRECEERFELTETLGVAKEELLAMKRMAGASQNYIYIHVHTCTHIHFLPFEYLESICPGYMLFIVYIYMIVVMLQLVIM